MTSSIFTEPHEADELEPLMGLALAEAAKALVHGDVPIGALVVLDGKVIASRHNERELTGDPTAHAEVLAIRDAAEVVGSWRLLNCTLVVTLEPCAMCAGAVVNSRLERVVYGAADLAAGGCLSLYNICDDARLNHSARVIPDVRSAECAELLTDFFGERRP